MSQPSPRYALTSAAAAQLAALPRVLPVIYS
jgi:hypothetical protein